MAEAAEGKTRSRSLRAPYAGLGLVTLAWGAGPVITKLVTAPPHVGAVWRFGISVPVLFALVALRGRKVSVSTLFRAAPGGIGFGINLMFVFATVQESTVAVLAVAIALQPAVILVLAGPLFGERPTLAHVLWTVVGIGGAAGVVLGAGSGLEASPLGVLYALLAMLTFTVYFLATRMARTRGAVDPVEWMAAINLWALVAVVPVALVVSDPGDFAEVGGYDYLWLAVLAYFTGVFGHIVMSWVHGFVEASRSSLALLAMNVIAVSLAWPVHEEPVTVIQAFAGAVVLVAVGAVVRLPTRPAA